MKRWLLISAIVILAAVFAVSLYFVLTYQAESRENEQIYVELSDMVEDIRATLPPEQPHDPTDPAPQYNYAEVEDEETAEPVKLLPEYVPIFKLNNDTVGWISIADTKINYPVVQTVDTPNYYINHNFYKESSKYGAIYAAEHCDVEESDNVVIYGHRMNDGSMFADLLKYKDKTFYESHKYIRFDTLHSRQTYEIIAVFQIESVNSNNFDYHHFTRFQAESQFNTFMSRIDLLELYDTGVEANYGDRLITLSTCEKNYKNGRLVVVAKQIEP